MKMTDTTITITIERYTELLRKEMGYDYRRTELGRSGYVCESDKIIFGLINESIPVGCVSPNKDDDF